MNYSLFDFVTLIGSLSLFLYGMKLMSESLQKVAGNKMRSILAFMTQNQVLGVLTGLLITAVIQSSAATTVMLVSFVNAGLMSLVQSIGVIMGANIGTTVTAWIISLFGFSFDISKFAVPLMAFAIPLVFSKKENRKNWGEFLMGFSMLFIGLEMLKNSVPDVEHNPQILEFLKNYTDMGYGSILLFLLIGTVLTIVVQSSSAMMAITLVMCAQGWLDFRVACAMVLGENIGTTITANLAAWNANVAARRTALAHTIFNLIGVCWMLIVFYPFTSLVQTVVEVLGATNDATVQTFSLSLYHSMFNIANVLLLGWFTKFIANIVTRLIPQRDDDEEFRLRYISAGGMSTAELSMLQAQKEILVYANRVNKMFGFVKELKDSKKEEDSEKWIAKTAKYEEISDRMELEIANYLNKVSEGRLSPESKDRIHHMLRMVSEIESVADSCDNMSQIYERKNIGKIEFTKTLQENVEKMFGLLDEAMDGMFDVLNQMDAPYVQTELNEDKEKEINRLRNKLKTENIIDVNEHKYSYETSVVYMDLINECEKMGDYIVNIVEAVSDYKPRD